LILLQALEETDLFKGKKRGEEEMLVCIYFLEGGFFVYKLPLSLLILIFNLKT
jgi:hypothetical protein